MSLLTIVQGISQRLGFAQPSTAYGSSDPYVSQIVAFTQDAGDEILERWDAQTLKGSYNPVTFTGDGTTATFNLPADFKALSPSDTFISSKYPTLVLPGPINEEDLMRLKAVPFNILPSVWRRIGNAIEFYPVLTAGEVVSYVYGGKNWITDSSGVTPRSAWAADGDLSRIPDRLIRLGALWRYKRAKGLDYSEEFAAFEKAFTAYQGQDKQERVIDISKSDYMPNGMIPILINQP